VNKLGNKSASAVVLTAAVTVVRDGYGVETGGGGWVASGIMIIAPLQYGGQGTVPEIFKNLLSSNLTLLSKLLILKEKV